MVASPVRNRAWILPEFLAALRALDHPPPCLSFYFLANDCTDASVDILRAWDAPGSAVRVEERSTGVVGWNRYQWPRYDFDNLANLRNHIVARFLESAATHLFSVDSDIVVPPSALRELLVADRPVVAGVISNFPGVPVEESPAHNFMFRSGNLYAHSRTVPAGVFEVDVTGAVVLIRRDVLEAGVRYAAHGWGEDIAFCEHARRRGFHLWAHGGVRCEHRMEDPGMRRGTAGPFPNQGGQRAPRPRLPVPPPRQPAVGPTP